MTTDQMIARADFFFITEGTEHTESIRRNNKKLFSVLSVFSVV
jgi:hypothetical protein